MILCDINNVIVSHQVPNNPLRTIKHLSECDFCPSNCKLAVSLSSIAQNSYHSFIIYILTYILAQSLYASNCEILVVSLFVGRLELLLGSQCLSA
jgi:hypothetical protein